MLAHLHPRTLLLLPSPQVEEEDEKEVEEEEPEEPSAAREWLKKAVNSSWFEAVIIVFIVVTKLPPQ